MVSGYAETEYEIMDFTPELVSVGTTVIHKKFGRGVVTCVNDSLVNVRFGAAYKAFNWPDAFYNGFLFVIEGTEVELDNTPMNKDYVLDCIKPYLDKDQQISRVEFISIFGQLMPEEIDKIHSIITEAGIVLVEETSEESAKIDRDLRRLSTSNDDGYEHMLQLTNEQLCVMAQAGDQRAKAAIVKKNIRFIYGLAIRYSGIFKRSGLDMIDMYQEGNLGLLVAIDKFDVSLGYKFLTYAGHWVMQTMTRAAIDTGYTIRIPVHMFEKVMKLYSYRKRFPEYGDSELFAAMYQDGFMNSMEEFKKINDIAQCYLDVRSLNQTIGEAEDFELQDIIPDEKQPSVESIVILKVLREQLSKVLETLTPREAEIIRQRFGWDDGKIHTLEELGKQYSLTRERIRQIEAKALRKIRHPNRSKRLVDYLG